MPNSNNRNWNKGLRGHRKKINYNNPKIPQHPFRQTLAFRAWMPGKFKARALEQITYWESILPCLVKTQLQAVFCSHHSFWQKGTIITHRKLMKPKPKPQAIQQGILNTFCTPSLSVQSESVLLIDSNPSPPFLLWWEMLLPQVLLRIQPSPFNECKLAETL